MVEQEARFEAVDVLWDDDMDGLMLTLGARVKAKQEGIAEDELQMWDPPEEAFAVDVEAGPEWTAMMKKFGQRWWEKLEPKLYDLICNEENEEHDKLMEALGEGAKTLAVALAGLIVAPGVVPAIAIVVATIAAKKIFESGRETACEMWKESMAAKAEAEAEAPAEPAAPGKELLDQGE